VNLRSLVCPVDFSEPSQQALRWAVALAARYRSRLTVLTAVDPLLAEAARERFGMDLAKGETEPALREFARAVVPEHASWTPSMTFDVRVGDPSDVILEAARRENIDLIVMGTQGLGGLRKVILGSTAERVLRRTHTPVLAVPPHETQSIVLDASGARVELTRILVGTDFSGTSAAAIEWAAEVAHDLATSLTLAHVVEPVSVPPQWLSYVAESDEARIREARAKLEQLSRTHPGAQTADLVVSLGRPADAIASIAEERGAGLIVVGLTGDQGALAPRPGSIAYRVLCMARVPVLVVPPKSL
jgi:nucleotide-binding universal stress UspA family protein